MKEAEDPEENSSIQSAAADICISLKRFVKYCLSTPERRLLQMG